MADEQTERFVDEYVNPIPPQNTWDTLSTNQLIDTKTALMNSAFGLRSNKVILTALNKAIDDITRMILQRTS